MYAVEFSPDGKQVLSGGTDGAIKVWDTETLQPMITLDPGSGEVSDVIPDLEWSPDGETIAAARLDGTIDLWKLGSPQDELDP